jgi:monooxygenase
VATRSATGSRQITPRLNNPDVLPQPAGSLASGYIQRSLDRLPKQGSKRPWRLYQNYAFDLFTLKFGRLEDGTLEFKRA